MNTGFISQSCSDDYLSYKLEYVIEMTREVLRHSADLKTSLITATSTWNY